MAKKKSGSSHEPHWKYGKPVPPSFFEILREQDPDGQETQHDGTDEDPGEDPERCKEGDQCQD